MQQALQASGAEVALIARAGQDLSRYGLRWSHLGFAYREAAAEPGQPPRWHVLHKLNPCGTARGELYRQGLGEFFLDQPHRYEAVMQPLAPWLQQQLLPLLRNDQAAARLHTPRYSMVTVESVQRFVSLQGLGQTPTLVQRPAVRVPADPAPVPAPVPFPVPASARSPA